MEFLSGELWEFFYLESFFHGGRASLGHIDRIERARLNFS